MKQAVPRDELMAIMNDEIDELRDLLDTSAAIIAVLLRRHGSTDFTEHELYEAHVGWVPQIDGDGSQRRAYLLRRPIERERHMRSFYEMDEAEESTHAHSDSHYRRLI